MSDIDYCNLELAARDAVSISRWLATVRLHCVVKTPGCVYSDLQFDRRYPIKYRVAAIAVPDIVSNTMSEVLERYRAREAFLGELDQSVRDVLIGSGVLHAGAWHTSDKHYMLGGRWRVSMTTCVRLGEMLIEATRVVARVDVRRELVQAVAALDRGLVEPAPLFEDEVSWLREHGYRWQSGVVDRGAAR